MARGYAYAKIESISVYVRVFRKIEYAYDMLRSSLNSKILERMVFIHANTKLIDKVIGVCGNRYFEKEVKVIWQKAPHPIPRLGVTPGGRKLHHWIPGVGFPISVP